VAERRGYPTDLFDVEWAGFEPLMPPVMPGERPRKHLRRELIDALAYWVRAGGYSLGCGARPASRPQWPNRVGTGRPRMQSSAATPRVGVGHFGGRNGCACFCC